jgi:hypothetical protein
LAKGWEIRNLRYSKHINRQIVPEKIMAKMSSNPQSAEDIKEIEIER